MERNCVKLWSTFRDNENNINDIWKLGEWGLPDIIWLSKNNYKEALRYYNYWYTIKRIFWLYNTTLFQENNQNLI